MTNVARSPAAAAAIETLEAGFTDEEEEGEVEEEDGEDEDEVDEAAGDVEGVEPGAETGD